MELDLALLLLKACVLTIPAVTHVLRLLVDLENIDRQLTRLSFWLALACTLLFVLVVVGVVYYLQVWVVLPWVLSVATTLLVVGLLPYAPILSLYCRSEMED